MYLKGILIIVGFLALGNAASQMLGNFIPGSVCGMVLLFAALAAKIIKADDVRPVADFLTKNMSLFFVPASIGIMEQWGLISSSLIGWVGGIHAKLPYESSGEVSQEKSEKMHWTQKRIMMQTYDIPDGLIYNVPVMLALTIGSYLLGVYLKNKSGLSLLHPFLICIPTIVAILYFTGVPCSFYMEANGIIEFMLGPSVVALGLLLYDHMGTIRKNALPILISVFTGSVVGVRSVYLLCRVFALDEIFVKSLEPKSVTTPIAMDLSASIGGNVSLTAVSVVLCGFIGAVAGPVFLRMFRIGNPVSRGLALGCSAHGLGTSRAIETGAVEGAVSGLAIALMGLMTAIVIPIFNLLFPLQQ